MHRNPASAGTFQESCNVQGSDKRDVFARIVPKYSDIICLPIRDITPHVAQMMRQNPTDPVCSSAIEGDTKMPDPVNRTQVPMLQNDIMLPSTGHKMKAEGFSVL
jgi:hypothetical protein